MPANICGEYKSDNEELVFKVSIIIVSIKEAIETLSSLKGCPVPYSLTISRLRGLGRARNNGANRANDGLLIFLDDDIFLEAEAWKELLSTELGCFKMYDNGSPRIPYSSRVVAIWSKDFRSIGGFDEEIIYYAEDVDFLIRALRNGLRFSAVSADLVKHIDHLPRSRAHIRNYIGMRFDQGNLIVKHGLTYFYIVHGGLLHYVKRVVRHPRSHMPTFFGVFYHILRRFKHGLLKGVMM